METQNITENGEIIDGNIPEEFPKAGFFVRFLAFLIDVFALAITLFTLGFALDKIGSPILPGALFCAIFVSSYFFIAKYKYKKTIGKLFCGLEIVKPENEKVRIVKYKTKKVGPIAFVILSIYLLAAPSLLISVIQGISRNAVAFNGTRLVTISKNNKKDVDGVINNVRCIFHTENVVVFDWVWGFKKTIGSGEYEIGFRDLVSDRSHVAWTELSFENVCPKVNYNTFRQSNVVIYDIANIFNPKEIFRTKDTSVKRSLSMNDNILVWADNRGNGGISSGCDNCYQNRFDIYGYNFLNGKESVLIESPYLKDEPKLYGNFLTWSDYRNKAGEIFMMNLISKQEEKISNTTGGVQNVSIDKQKIKWIVPASCDTIHPSNEGLYEYDIIGKTTNRIRTFCGSN